MQNDLSTASAEKLATVKTSVLFPLKRLVLDLLITGAFWVFMSGVLRAHVPSDDPFWITVWSCISALCISGVFFLALQMFRLVLHDTPEE
jgi:drug/metabolite transporter (DMT)-like permease